MRHLLTFCLLFLARFATAQADYYIKFPDDINATYCFIEEYYTPPQLFNTNGANITISYNDSGIILTESDACYTIERTWTVKSANYDVALPCIYVPNPNPSVLNAPENLVGPIVSPNPWSSTTVRVNPTDTFLTNFSTFWSATANCYQYKQVIRFIDTDPPILNCPAVPPTFADTTANDPQLWNAPYWFDPALNTSDLRDGVARLIIRPVDLCSGTNLTVRYLLFLDLDQDGIMETVINSDNPPAPGQVNYNNASNLGYTGGISQEFDQRPVDVNLKYRFGVHNRLVFPQTSADGFLLSSVGWHTEQSPDIWMEPQLPVGTHKIKWFAVDNCGNEATCEYNFTVLTLADYRILRGKVQIDDNLNCEAESNETSVSYNWKMKLDHLNPDGSLLSSEYQAIAPNHQYYFLLDTGNYRLSTLPANVYFSPCYDTLLNVTTVGNTSEINFPVQITANCPFLETDIGTPHLRNCFDNTYTVRYTNTGTAAAENAFVRVKLDPFMSFVSATAAETFEGNNTWRFDLGEVPIYDYNSFTLVVHLNCDSTIAGQTHCVEAHIYPDSLCSLSPAWSGANVDVDGACQPDSVRFVLRNTGNAATSLLDYIVIEDNIITLQAPFQIPAGDSVLVSVPANGSTWRLQAEQEPGNPYNPMPSATVEACGQNPTGGVSIGFVSQFGESDGDPFVSIDCQTSIGSYDPNDKQGFPLGYGDEHLIEPGQPLDYLIRFQNTGTDTAFTVVVRDTLAAWLDPASVVPGASSHAYRFVLSEAGLLTFRFENILLPDSNVNEMASHGFVKFRVRQRDAVPLGTVIHNRAAIYFDFNAPVLTNETWHQVGVKFVTSGTKNPGSPDQLLPIRVIPNPARNGALLRFENLAVPVGRFDLYDARGQFVMSRPLTGNQVSLEAVDLPSGMYFFKIFGRGKMQGVGKVSFM